LSGHQSHPISLVRHGHRAAVVPHSFLPVRHRLCQVRSMSYSEETMGTWCAFASTFESSIGTHF
jgi:hypothetical protein